MAGRELLAPHHPGLVGMAGIRGPQTLGGTEPGHLKQEGKGPLACGGCQVPAGRAPKAGGSRPGRWWSRGEVPG
jgi:hypothetical protein